MLKITCKAHFGKVIPLAFLISNQKKEEKKNRGSPMALLLLLITTDVGWRNLVADPQSNNLIDYCRPYTWYSLCAV